MAELEASEAALRREVLQLRASHREQLARLAQLEVGRRGPAAPSAPARSSTRSRHGPSQPPLISSSTIIIACTCNPAESWPLALLPEFFVPPSSSRGLPATRLASQDNEEHATARAERAEAFLGGPAQAEATLALLEQQASLLPASLGRAFQLTQAHARAEGQVGTIGPAAARRALGPQLASAPGGTSGGGRADPTEDIRSEDAEGSGAAARASAESEGGAGVEAEGLRRALAAAQERAQRDTAEIGVLRVRSSGRSHCTHSHAFTPAS